MADCNGYKAPKTTTHRGAADRAAGDELRRHPPARRHPRRAVDLEVGGACPPEQAGDPGGARPARRDHAPAAQGMPVGPRAGRAHDRPAHGRGGLRARRRGAPGRRREAARRARRRALPGALPLAAARGARRRRPGPGGRALHREADPPPPARVRRRRGRDRRRGAAATGTRSSSASPAASRACSARCPRTSPGRCTRARSSAARPRAGSTSPASRADSSRCATSSTSSRRPRTPEERFHELGDVLFAAVNVARKLQVDPELALRAASDRFRGRVRATAASWPHPTGEAGTI